MNSLSLNYIALKLDERGVLTLEDCYGTDYEFCMFGRFFGWVEKDKIYKIYDLLNDWDVAE